MEKVISKRDDFVVDALLFLSQRRDFCTGCYVQFWGFKLLREQRRSAVTGDEILVFAVRIGKVSYNSLI